MTKAQIEDLTPEEFHAREERKRNAKRTDLRLYRVEMTIAATAYIKAGTPAQAAEKARSLRGRALDVDDNESEVAISGQPYSTFDLGEIVLNPDLPEVSLSPAMTIIGARGVEAVEACRCPAIQCPIHCP